MCALYNPPVEELTEFNTAVFKQDDTPLTKMKSLFLGRVGNPISVATSTQFNGGDIYVQGARIGLGAGSIATNTAFGYNTLSQNTTGANNLAIGYAALDANTFGFNNVAIGTNSAGAITTGSRNVAVGYEAFKTGTIYNNSVALGAATVIAGNQAVAIGYLASASDSQIVLGTTAETVLCKGTTANGSLIASADMYAKSSIRMGMGNNPSKPTPETSEQTAFGYGCLTSTSISSLGSTAVGYNCLSGSLYSGGSNTGVGANCLASLRTGSNTTAVGYNAGKNFVTTSFNTLIGSNSGINISSGGTHNTLVGSVQSAASGALTTGTYNTLIGNNAGSGTNPNFCSSLGTYTNVGVHSRSTAIGGGSVTVPGATCTVSNQIMLGTSTEFVQCPGNTATGSIKLGGSIQLQASYSAAPTEPMLGYQLSNVSAGGYSISSFTTGTATNLLASGLTLGAGVWSINTSLDLEVVDAPVTVTLQCLYMSNAASQTYSTHHFNNTGNIRDSSTQTYPTGVSSIVYSTSFCYYVNTSTTIYPHFQIDFTGAGTVGGDYYYTATRMA